MYSLEYLQNGFTYISVRNKVAYAKIALQGAHIFDYRVDGKESFLWLSEQSSFEAGKAIRGGIPLCWPRFGNRDRQLPQHGFARVMLFDLISVEERTPSLTRVHLQLKSSEKSRAIWNFEFVLDVIFDISERLKISMTTHNVGSKEFLLTQAFHTYFKVSDIHDVIISGLEGVVFLDTLRELKELEHKPIVVREEIDRVYEGVIDTILLHDKEKDIKIVAENSASVIVWNPWIMKCLQMSGMKDDAYRAFICIESANAFDDFKIIKPNQKETIAVHYQEV